MAPSQLFVLCCSRSGSTLLRYILDTHPKICCPPELHLYQVALHLKWVFEHTSPTNSDASEKDKAKLINRKIYKILDHIMSSYTKAEEKDIWCEKSVFTIQHIKLIENVFPKAKYICLYRNCFDQVDSALDSFSTDPTGKAYGYTAYIQNANDKTNGLVDYWLGMTTAILNYEKQNPKTCVRVKYETIASESETALRKLFKFIDVKWDKDLVDRVFSQHHKIGPGDHKILQTTEIKTSSINKKSQQQLSKNITPDRIQKINELHQQLGYSSLIINQ